MYHEQPSTLTRHHVLTQYIRYAEEEMAHELIHHPTRAPRLRRTLMRPIFQLFAGEKLGGKYRALIEAKLKEEGTSVTDIIQSATSVIAPEILHATPIVPNTTTTILSPQ
eukprot:CAMPEP_0114368690 /NCGR_PEP_ID=MMETSP0101-20121206/31060_1 /TAXON_ID=38822 ORGANISM="Pteridomonas danica, Strain PT" /NCGR_SAMPLE_ID=MMETSP0101 /ASSEMBLY_ACC=CAM_ASM_000211 /LENGTH=109 /DNA_ID=CAMNT_0001519067 /DNA_START=66 /DNA_END=395 /DNA_ORIENTATION=-